jgi:hypothetical protein
MMTDSALVTSTGIRPRRIPHAITNRATSSPPVAPFHTRAFWRSFAPRLHIEDRSLLGDISYFDLAAAKPERLAAQWRDDGYIQDNTIWGLDLKSMADTVRLLSAANLSPLFAFVYDEFWLPFRKLHPLYRALLGGDYCLLPDFWIWNVDKGEAGWRPHRDKGRKSLCDDGLPKSLTTWIPLSTATPLNGCMYVVPAQFDPTYATSDESAMRFDYQSIRALPANPGDFFIWNQAIFHWAAALPNLRRNRA